MKDAVGTEQNVTL